MQDLLSLLPTTLNQIVALLIPVMVAYFGYRFHERMRLQHYFGELRVWSSSCLDCLSEAVHLCELDPALTVDPSFFNRRHNVLQRLSSSIDQGRWFFPNAEVNDAENWRLDSYHNFERRPLDDLVYAYGAVKRLSYKDQAENVLMKAPLVEIKKDFTSSIQVLLDPKKAHKQFGLAMKQNYPR